jgi:hypothetical protein
MSIALRKRRPDDVEFGLVYGTMAILALVTAYFFPFTDLLPSCVFNTMTGIPCPTCGVTRSLVHLAQGNFLTAFRMNPLFALMIVTALLAFMLNAISLIGKYPRITLTLTPSHTIILRAAVILIFLINWVYLISTH